MKNEKVLYIPKGYIKDEELKYMIYIRDSYNDELLGKIWRNYDFEKAERKLFELQCKLTKETFKNNITKMRRIQDKIVYSSEAKMLAVRKVTEISKSKAGIDKIVWRKDSDKMRGAIILNNGEYKASPLKQFIFTDKKSSKERQIRYSYSL